MLIDKLNLDIHQIKFSLETYRSILLFIYFFSKLNDYIFNNINVL
ncbi:hypothetical protein ADIS_1714 [Lunatimonas lonarensis]|uniref:Uncharacterized protein n=1 Tax=Lunatimonas lonarensis TaxID=1232681 RepID=R7ZUG9_9BACT|nr:hypothetical protein ADIS_1714 [Lunatimonas lonarensis]